MPEKIFQQTFVSSRPGRKTWLVVVSFIGQTFVVFLLILMPLIYTDAPPPAQLTSFLIAPPPPPPPPPSPPARKTEPVVRRQFDRDKLLAPQTIPANIPTIVDDEPPQSNAVVPGGLTGAPPDGLASVIGKFNPSPVVVAPPPPVENAAQPAIPKRIPVGGLVQQANLIRKIQPVYPPLARQARIEGVVRFTAIIGKGGDIQNLQLLAGHPLLVDAARKAVSEWRYKPTLLNGEPVEVVTQIDVNFTLTR